jgi:predicted MFS family arabinose efflux permease
MRANRLELSGGSRRWAFVIGAGIFATTLAQSNSLDLPLRDLLKNEFHAPLHTISQFFGIAAFPWYLKIVVGVFSDSIPLLGTLRRHYLLLSATAASGLWLFAGYAQRSYLLLIITITAMEAMLVVGSTVVGGLLVEVGQRLNAAGRLVAARIVVESICAVLAGPFAGYLAGVPFEMAAAAGALIAFSMAPIAFIWLREPAMAKPEASAVADAYHELRDILSSRPLWIAAAFIFVASVPQGFPTPLWNFQKTGMNFSDTTIGYLRGAAGAGGVLAAVVYGFVYRRLPLRALIALGIAGSACGSLVYVFYSSLPAAVAIDSTNGFLTTLWVLAMMEMAVWVAPGSAAAAGFALLMGATNAGSALGDYLASQLVDWGWLSFSGIAALSAGATTAMLAPLAALPRMLFGPAER